MHKINRSALVPYPPEALFRLVDDVAHYQDFLPWCEKSEEVKRDEVSVVGKLHVLAKGMRQSFTTRNTLSPHDGIDMQLVDGPFKSLQGVWRFEPLGEEGCKISLDLSFQFSNRLMDIALAPFFNQAIDSMVDAFCQRADSVYGAKA